MSDPANQPAPSATPAPEYRPAPKSSPGRWRPWLAAALIFVFGFGAGGVSAVAIGVRAVRKRAALPPAAPTAFADRQVERIARDVEKELNLTPEQAQRVREELNRTAANLKQVRARVLRDVNREFRESVVRIGASLPQEKRREFRELVRDRFKRAGLRQDDDAAPEPAP